MSKIVGSEIRANDCEKHEDHNDRKCNNRALILSESDPRILEVTYRLGIKLLVVNLFSTSYELKLFLRNIHNFIIHHFLEPILILGSMNP